MNDLTIVIPVREGSERVKNKNFKKFADSNLLQLKIEQVKKLQIGEIIVNTDSDIAIEIAKKNNVKYHRREKYYASSKCTGSEYFTHLAKVTESKNILISPVTSPLIKIETIEKCINIFFENDCDSLMTVKDVREFLWENNKPINYDLSNAPNSQDLPELFCPTFGVVLAKRESILKHKNWICGKSYFHKVSIYLLILMELFIKTQKVFMMGLYMTSQLLEL
jgi:N-acylneuraminate cytidylyltransferase